MKNLIKIFSILCAVALVASLCAVFAFAEEQIPTPTTENETEGEISPSAEDGETPFVFSDYFKDKILPLLTSSTALTVVSFAVAVWLKSGGKKKDIEHAELLGQYNKLLQLYESDKDFKDTLRAMVNETVEAVKDTVLKELKLDPEKYAELTAAVETVTAKVEALRNGAMIAWGQSPAAREALTSEATHSALVEAQMQCKAYEDYIREIKGDEAEKIIAEVREA